MSHAPLNPRNLTARCVARVLLIPLASLLAGCAEQQEVSTALPESEAVRSFLAAESRGYDALDADSLEVALASFDAMQAIFPDSPMGHYHRACALSRTGTTEGAVAEMNRAIELGFSDLHRLETDPDLAAVREHAHHAAMVSAMEANLESQRAALRGALQTLPPAGEPAFPTLDSLDGYYDDLYFRAAVLRRVYAAPIAARRTCELLGHKLAALDRYKMEHDDLGERYRADLERLTSLGELPEMEGRPWVTGRETVMQVADEILSSYPDSSGAAMAALWKARAAWYGQQAASLEETPTETVDDAVATFRRVAREYPGTPGGAQALAEAIALTAETTDRDAEAIEPLVAELVTTFEPSRETMGRYAYEVNEFILRQQGAPDFTATDIDGQIWNLEALRGRAALIDFWATWCGPCRAEMPTLVELRAQYGDDLQILGISLDRLEQLPVEEFRTWLADHQMDWPQIYDGEGWETALSQLYNVPAIPFPVLLDRDGSVAAAGLGARGEALREKLAELLGG